MMKSNDTNSAILAFVGFAGGPLPLSRFDLKAVVFVVCHAFLTHMKVKYTLFKNKKQAFEFLYSEIAAIDINGPGGSSCKRCSQPLRVFRSHSPGAPFIYIVYRGNVEKARRVTYCRGRGGRRIAGTGPGRLFFTITSFVVNPAPGNADRTFMFSSLCWEKRIT